jgi:hypothetical protein
VSLTISPPSTPIYFSTLDDGTRLGLGVLFCPPLFQYYLKSQLDSSRGACWGLYYLPFPPPLDWRLWLNVPLPQSRPIILSISMIPSLPFQKHPMRSVTRALWRQQSSREPIGPTLLSTQAILTSLLTLLLNLPDRLSLTVIEQ